MGDPLGSESWRVECRSGWTYAERPAVLVENDKRWEIAGVERMWRGPQGRHFVVRIEDGRSFHLLYNEAEERWLVGPA